MRALVLSDIHANLEAMEAVLAAADGMYEELWNLGDTVGYGGNPNETVDRMRATAVVNVRGNHDRVCCGASSGAGFNPVAKAAAQWTAKTLTAKNLAWLEAMELGPVERGGAACAHGSPLDEDDYILNVRDAWEPLRKMVQPLTFFGHTHVQGVFALEGAKWHEGRPKFSSKKGGVSWTLPLDAGMRYLINPGSVGQPRDHDWRAAFAVYDTEKAEVTFHRVPYDLAAAQQKIVRAGLPERLAARLKEGR